MVHIGVATSVGKVRTLNEDAYWFSEHIFVVCDGMGGHQGGEVASALATNVIKEYQFNHVNPMEDISRAIHQAHQRVIAEAKEPNLAGMGTTIVLAVIKEDQVTNDQQLYVGHVGDSRAYLLREQKLMQLTEDHSVVAELLRNGSLTEHEAIGHPHRNVVTQALGIGEIKVETNSFPIQSGDLILLCTDGLTDVVSEQQIKQVLKDSEPAEAATDLVNLANQEGGPDNTTALVILVP